MSRLHSAVATMYSVIMAMVAAFSPPASAEIVRAVEYYHQAFEHYFVTANPAEIAALDSGEVSGWWRTGQRYRVDDAPAEGLVPVCRFFTSAYADKASHFFTASTTECEHVKTMPDWTYEGVAFYARVPDAAGNCAAGTAQIHRLFNNGQGGAPNHAYTANSAKRDRLIRAGWISEGAAFCTLLATADPLAQTQVLAGEKWDFPWPLPLGRHDPVLQTQFYPQPFYVWDEGNEFAHFQLPPPEVYIVLEDRNYANSSPRILGEAAWDPFAGSYVVVSASDFWGRGELLPTWTFDDAQGPSTSVCMMNPQPNFVGSRRLHPIEPFLWSGCQLGVAHRL